MPATINVEGDLLAVHIEGADKLWALKSRLEIPIANVTGVHSAEDEARQWLHGIRLVGMHIPGVVSAGRFYSHGKWMFWDVHDPAKAISIDLQHEDYSQLVVEVEDPGAQTEQIRAAIAGSPPPGH
jgi:hypothetical protein